MTVRLPFDMYREMNVRAEARNWSMSDYVAWCVAKELSGKYVQTKVTTSHNSRSSEVASEWIEEMSG
jgi:hypothetical protein